VQYKTVNIPLAGDFSALPIQIIPNINGPINISVTGNGLVSGTSGLRWWDSNILTDSGNVTGISGVPIVFPFGKDFMANYLVDIIALVRLDSRPFVYAASSSPDNVVLTTGSIDTKLFYLELFCFGLNGNVGNSSANADYMMGGTPDTAAATSFAKVYLYPDAAINGSFTVSARFVPNIPDIVYSNAASFSKTVNYSSGATIVNLLKPEELFLYYYNNYGKVTWSTPGHYKITVTCSDSSYNSMLKVYHWAIA
jgi:hypothetical protein